MHVICSSFPIYNFYFFSLSSATPGKVCRQRDIIRKSTFITYLALEQLERSTTTSRDVAEFLLLAGVGDDGSGVTTTNNDGRSVLDSLDTGLKEGRRALGESWELEDTSGTVPENCLGLGDSLGEQFTGFRSSVKTHPIGGDTLLVGSGTNLTLVTITFATGSQLTLASLSNLSAVT